MIPYLGVVIWNSLSPFVPPLDSSLVKLLEQFCMLSAAMTRCKCVVSRENPTAFSFADLSDDMCMLFRVLE